MNAMIMPAAAPQLDSHLSFDESTMPDDDIDLFDFPPSLDDWARDKKVCQYFNADDEAETCGTDPEYFIRADHCWDPGCHEVHTWYYCLRHFAANIGYLAREICALPTDLELTRYVRCGDIPPRYQLIEWGRIGEEGTHELPHDSARTVR